MRFKYELGLFVGCKTFGTRPHKDKRSLTLDRERFRFQKFTSDIAGNDIEERQKNPEMVVRRVRDWLATNPKADRSPGASAIVRRFRAFCIELPELCARLQLAEDDLANFIDFHHCVSEWLSV